MAHPIANAVVFYCNELRSGANPTTARLTAYSIAKEGTDITAVDWDELVNAIDDLRQSDQIHTDTTELAVQEERRNSLACEEL